jgi:hypothetical protein
MGKKKRPEPKFIFMVDEAGRQKAERILFDELGSACSLDWSLPRSVGAKGDDRFVGDSLVIVPQSKEALEIVYGGLTFVRHGSGTPLGELSGRFTGEVHEIGRVLIDITSRDG